MSDFWMIEGYAMESMTKRMAERIGIRLCHENKDMKPGEREDNMMIGKRMYHIESIDAMDTESCM